jgi:DNA-binding beta-propeller fold protein YncE
MRAPLKYRALLVGCLLALGCAQQATPRPSPDSRFYFPSSLSFFLPQGATSGILYVASANYDRRFDQGNLLAVNLDRVQAPSLDGGTTLIGLPPPATPTGDLTSAVQFTDLATQTGDVVQIQSFAAEMLRDATGYGGRPRLWVATRAEGDLLEGISTDPDGEGLLCIPGGNNCVFTGLSLGVEQIPATGLGRPAAPEPYGLGMSRDGGQLWVTHIRPADAPPNSGLNLQNYVVYLDARVARPEVVVPDSFVPIGLGAGNSLVVGGTNVFVSGRTRLSSTSPDILIRLVERSTLITRFPQIGQQYLSIAARGMAMRADESRIYLATLQPDTLLVVDVKYPLSDQPILTVVRAIPLPAGPNAVRLLERQGSGDVVAITCQDDGSVAVYADEIGQLGAIIGGVGLAPFDIAVDQRGDVARLFVSDFADGRVAVIDVALGGGGRPVGARLVATLGLQQGCILQTDDANCVGAQ